MRIKSYKVYSFSELSQEAQEKVIDSLRYVAVEGNWWDFVYEDARLIGLDITSFDIDRGAYCNGNWICAPLTVIKNITENHGKKCETYKTAMRYKKLLKGRNKENEQTEDDFRNELLEDYRILLQKEYDYLTSDEAVKEMIEANEYEFTIDGKRE